MSTQQNQIFKVHATKTRDSHIRIKDIQNITENKKHFLNQNDSHITIQNKITHQSQYQNCQPQQSQRKLVQGASNKNLLLVFLMHKGEKLSLFLNKGISLNQLTLRLYKEIYVFEKQTYSQSNSILKNLLNKITGFQSIDGDIILDYQLKYGRGQLNQQKFFTPFLKPEASQCNTNNTSHTCSLMPFKILSPISQSEQNSKFLVRDYIDGNFYILTSIRKNMMDQDQLIAFKKGLKYYNNINSILHKNSQNVAENSVISTINFFQNKSTTYLVTEFFPQSLQEYLLKKHEKLISFQQFQYIIQGILKILKILTLAKIYIKNIKLSDFYLSSECYNGQMKLCLGSLQRLIQLGYGKMFKNNPVKNTTQKRVSQKMTDQYYKETVASLIQNIHCKYLPQQLRNENEDLQSFMKLILQIQESQTCLTERLRIPNLLKNKLFHKKQNWIRFPQLDIDYKTKIQQYIHTSNLQNQSNNNNNNSSSTPTCISQMKQQIIKIFSYQGFRSSKNLRSQLHSKMILSSISNMLNNNGMQAGKQNIGNIQQFKKQQERKTLQKTKEKEYIQHIINEFNQNQDFLITTKINNIKSIEFYLKKSQGKLKRKMLGKIQTKYKKFLDKAQISQPKQYLNGRDSQNERVNTFNTFRNQMGVPQPSPENRQISTSNKKKYIKSFYISQTPTKPHSLLKEIKNIQLQNQVPNKIIKINEHKQHVSDKIQRHITNYNNRKHICNRKLITSPSVVKGNKTVQINLNQNQDREDQFTNKQNNFIDNISGKQSSKQILNQTSNMPPLIPSFLYNKSSKQQKKLIRNSQLNPISKQQKMVLIKKKYGIYLDQAQKQYNKIKGYRQENKQTLKSK